MEPDLPAAPPPEAQPAAPEQTPSGTWTKTDFGSVTVALEGARPSAEVMASSAEEFRESLQTLRGTLELLIYGKVPDLRQSKKFLNIAFREAEYLGNRVHDLQIASLLEAGKLRLKLTALNLQELLGTIVEKLSPGAAEIGASLEFEAPQELPLIRGDEALLRVLFSNLVERSLKAAPPNGTVHIQVEPIGERVRVQMLSSAGSSPKLAAITLDESQERGLAMYVAERIAYVHEAELAPQGIDGELKGFQLTLPVQLKGRGRGRVLVVDDNPQAATLLVYALEEEGFEAIKALNGLEGLKLARSERVDLVILDILLPGIDGFEVCHRLRSSPETASTPVIMISAKAREEDRATALRIGADAYFGKPLGMAELMVAIENLLEAGGAEDRSSD
ncbi:MAG: response regulator [Anaerolineales bacterium]